MPIKDLQPRRMSGRFRNWNVSAQEALRQILERLPGLGDSAEVELRGILSKARGQEGLAFAYANFHIRPRQAETSIVPDSLAYGNAAFLHEVIDVPEFTRRVSDSGLVAAVDATPAAAPVAFRIGADEHILPLSSSHTPSSSGSFSRYSEWPSSSVSIKLEAERPEGPFVRHAKDHPFLIDYLDMLRHYGGDPAISESDIRARALTVTLSDPRGRLLSVRGSGPDALAIQAEGTELERMTTHFRWTGLRGELLGFGSAESLQEVEARAPESARHVTVALVSADDELIDIAEIRLDRERRRHALLDLIKGGETATCEFKPWVEIGKAKLKEIEETVVAMSNGDAAGTLVIGITDLGVPQEWPKWMWNKYAGDSPKRSKSSTEERMQACAERYGHKLRDQLMIDIEPGPRLDISAVDLRPGIVLAVTVHPSPDPVHIHGLEDVHYVRRNASNRAANPKELRELFGR